MIMAISLDEAIKIENLDNVLFKRRENKMLLNDYQINVLNRNGINYLKYSNYKNLLFDIEELLNDNYDEELDSVSKFISEYVYYNETNK